MREWLVAGALIESDADLLLVRNVRRGGLEDWSTPGGVIDAADSTLIGGLTREVREETGLSVLAWHGPVYEVRADAVDLGWTLCVEVHRALAFEGELRVADPDGIVVEAAFFGPDECTTRLDGMARWVREPLAEWLEQRWDGGVHYHYEVRGTDLRSLDVIRVPSTRTS